MPFRELLTSKPLLRHGWEVSRAVARQWRDDRVSGVSAEVAFWLVLSIFPGLLATAALLGSIDTILGGDVAADAEARIVEELESTLGGDGGVTVEAARDLFQGTNAGALTFGVVLAIISASRGFAAIVRGLDVAYDIEAYRSWMHIRVTAFLLALGTIVIGALMLAMLVVGPLLGAGSDIADQLGMGAWFETFWRWGRLPTVVLAVIAWATTIYHVGPLHHTPWRWDLPGAVLAAISWLTATLGFRVYLGTVGSDNAIFGAVGGMLSLLLWVYLLSIGLLVGAELNQVLAQRHGVRFVAEGSLPTSEWIRRARRWIADRRYGRGS